MEKKVVSAFEYTIMLYADPEKAKNYRAETAEEVKQRIEKDLYATASKLKIVAPHNK